MLTTEALMESRQHGHQGNIVVIALSAVLVVFLLAGTAVLAWEVRSSLGERTQRVWIDAEKE